MKRNAKSTWVALAMAVSLLTVAHAWGQYGLYGSPTASYSTGGQVTSSATQQTVVYQATGPQQTNPNPMYASAAGPNLIAPANRAPATGAPPSYTSPASTQTMQQYPQAASQYPQATASTPTYPPYQPSTTPTYPSYSSTAATANYQAYPSYTSQPYTSQPTQPYQQYQTPATQMQQSSMYQMPVMPRFGSPQAAPVPGPQAPQAALVAPQRLQTPVPQPIVKPTALYDDPSCCDTTCGTETCDESCCEPCCEPCCPWYVSVAGLGMGRDQANRVWTSYQADEQSNQIMNTQDIEMSWAGGGEITFGRSFCCGTFGVEATYWQLARVTGHASITNPAGVSTPLDMRYVQVGPTDQDMSDLFDNALEHRLQRSNEAYNVEINALYYGRPGQSFHGYTVNWLMGARFLKFDDDLLFSSLESGTWEGTPECQGYLGDNIKNYMVGFQVGFQARSPQWHRFSTFLTTKFGVYNNHIKNDFLLYRGDGYNAHTDPTSGITANYPVHSTANVFSTIAEINFGIEWNFSPRLSAGVGYRVITISGIGLADNQIPFYIVDIPEIERIDCNGDLILHGAFASLNYGF